MKAPQPNVVLALVDEAGNEWVAAARMCPMIRYADGNRVEWLAPESLKDRAFTLTSFKMIRRPGDV